MSPIFFIAISEANMAALCKQDGEGARQIPCHRAGNKTTSAAIE
jgi:hypothetical protein